MKTSAFLTLSTVVYAFPLFDLTFHYGCAIVVAVLTAHMIPKCKRALLAAGAIAGVVVAFGMSYFTRLINTGEYRTWGEFITVLEIDYSLNDWREVLIPWFLVYVFAPFYLAWLMARFCRHRSLLGSGSSGSKSRDTTTLKPHRGTEM